MYSWDITKLHGPAKWTYYYLYVILDIYSRYAVGWMLATRESAVLAEKLIADTCTKEGISRDQLTLHAERGSSMTSKPVAFLLADLGVTQSHSRPHVSIDNPFSESAFKTLKYRPDFPKQFGSIEAARAHCQRFFAWYNDAHRHGGLGLHTPSDVHYGLAGEVRRQRAVILSAAYDAHPERFINKPPVPPQNPHALVDQPTRGVGGHHSVIATHRCLIQVDKFRDRASLDDIADHLARVARHTQGQTEFLVAQRDPARLHRIGDNGLEADSANCWIGDPVAFEEYQRIHLGTPSPQYGDHSVDPQDLAARLVGDPSRQIIRDGSIRTVGELTIRVLSEVDGFNYGAEAGMLVSDVHLGPPNQHGERDVLARAGASAGSFRYALLPPVSSGTGGLGPYIAEASAGALMWPARLDAPEIIHGESHRDFVSGVKSRHGLQLITGWGP